MGIAVYTPNGRREVKSELEGRMLMWNEAVNPDGYPITLHPEEVISFDRALAPDRIRYEIQTIKEEETVNGITVEYEKKVQVPVCVGSELTPEKSPDEYAPSIETVKDIPGIRVDALRNRDTTVRIAKTGNRLHTIVFTKQGVRCYSRNIKGDSGAFIDEEIKMRDAMIADAMIKEGRAMRMYSVEFPQFGEEVYVQNKSREKSGELKLVQKMIHGQNYRDRVTADVQRSRLEDEKDKDMGLRRSEKERKSEMKRGLEKAAAA